MVWRDAGVRDSSFSTSGRKPRSSISSASSSTTVADAGEVEVALVEQVDHAARRADDDVDAALQRLDLRLVGAAAVELQRRGPSGARRRSRGRRPPGPPARGSGRRRAPAACPARAGSSKPASPGATTRCSSGMPKPRVLPVPVLAWPMMSWPDSATGRVIAWIGNGCGDAGVGERRDDLRADVEVREARVVRLDAAVVGGTRGAVGGRVCRAGRPVDALVDRGHVVPHVRSATRPRAASGGGRRMRCRVGSGPHR